MSATLPDPDGLPPDRLFHLAIRHLGSHGATGPGPVDVEIIEHLRVKVPEDGRRAWLEAEQQSWEPWLEAQEGFIGRDLLWDPEHQEGILLIHWASREQWLAIPAAEVARVQERFEACARRAMCHHAPAGNPFPLVLSAEQPPASRLPPSRSAP